MFNSETIWDNLIQNLAAVNYIFLKNFPLDFELLQKGWALIKHVIRNN